MPLAQICAKKKIKKGEALIDRMGKAEMAAHLFRLTQTDERIKNQNIRGQVGLENAAFQVGRTVRKTVIDLSGTAPENLPAAEHVNDVRKKIKATNKNLKALDGGKKKPKRIDGAAGE